MSPQESSSPPLKNILLSAALIAVALIGSFRVLDQAAIDQLDASFKRALTTYALVRGINAVISVVQGTEVAIEPAGVGVILSPGEIFDPINDLAERFSWVMLLATSSLGAQRLLVTLGESWLLQVLMLLSIGTALWMIWTPAGNHAQWRRRISRLAIFFLVLRFAIPVTAVVGNVVYEHFLNNRYESAYQSLETTQQEIQELRDSEKPRPSDGSLLGKIGQWYTEAADKLAIDKRIAAYRDKLGNAVEHIIELIVIFVLQTVVLPLLFLALGLRLIRLINPLRSL